MKKLFYLILIIPFLSFGQITKVEREPVVENIIGSINDLGFGIGPMELVEITNSNNTTTKYRISYKNLKYMELSEYSSFNFYETGGDLEALYTLIMEGFDAPNEKVLYKHALNYKIYNEITVDIGEDGTIFLMYGKKGFAPITFKFLHKDKFGAESWSMWLSKKQINKLFGKK